MLSDPIADMLTRIRNAIMVGHSTVAIPYSNTKMAIAQILKDEGYVADVAVEEGQPASSIVITLKYWGSRRERRPVISDLKRVSKPGRRVYVGKGRHPLGAQRDGHFDPDHVSRHHDRPASSAPGRWWRGVVLRLVRAEHSAEGTPKLGRRVPVEALVEGVEGSAFPLRPEVLRHTLARPMLPVLLIVSMLKEG